MDYHKYVIRYYFRGESNEHFYMVDFFIPFPHGMSSTNWSFLKCLEADRRPETLHWSLRERNDKIIKKSSTEQYMVVEEPVIIHRSEDVFNLKEVKRLCAERHGHLISVVGKVMKERYQFAGEGE